MWFLLVFHTLEWPSAGYANIYLKTLFIRNPTTFTCSNTHGERERGHALHVDWPCWWSDHQVSRAKYSNEQKVSKKSIQWRHWRKKINDQWTQPPIDGIIIVGPNKWVSSLHAIRRLTWNWQFNIRNYSLSYEMLPETLHRMKQGTFTSVEYTCDVSNGMSERRQHPN